MLLELHKKIRILNGEIMVKNINTEIQRLLIVKEEINTFNRIKERYPKIIPISQAKYDELLNKQCLDRETIYYVIDKEVGQYIDGYMDIWPPTHLEE